MNHSENRTVPVGLGDRSYEINIGSGTISTLGDVVQQISPNGRVAIVTDYNVDRAQGDVLRNVLTEASIDHITISVEPGEPSKSWPVLQDVAEQIIAAQLERNDLIVAFGGGVVGDLAGFAASIVRRGMRFIQVPTSLLAQVDSSVGGKTGINSQFGKNLIGAFYQPAHVIIDLDFVKTLSPREFRAGYAEVVKYGLIGYPEFFEDLDLHHDEVFSHGPKLAEAVARSCAAKAEIVAEDETEQGRRALLNLGHTFGHALEGFAGYDSSKLVHGEGVAIGMMLAHQFSNRMNQCSVDDVARVESHLKSVGLPTRIQDIPGETPSAEVVMKFIAQDKKVKRGKLTFILTKGIGRAYIADDVQPEEVSSFLNEKINR